MCEPVWAPGEPSHELQTARLHRTVQAEPCSGLRKCDACRRPFAVRQPVSMEGSVEVWVHLMMYRAAAQGVVTLLGALFAVR